MCPCNLPSWRSCFQCSALLMTTVQFHILCDNTTVPSGYPVFTRTWTLFNGGSPSNFPKVVRSSVRGVEIFTSHWTLAISDMNPEGSVNKMPHCCLDNMGSVPTRGSSFTSSQWFIPTLTSRNPESGRLPLTGKTAGDWSYVFTHLQRTQSLSLQPTFLYAVKFTHGIKFMLLYYWFCKIVWLKLADENVSPLLHIWRFSDPVLTWRPEVGCEIYRGFLSSLQTISPNISTTKFKASFHINLNILFTVQFGAA